MSWGTLRVGRVELSEPPLRAVDEKVDASTGAADVTVTGQEASPLRTHTGLLAVREDLLSLLGAQVPVVFEQKTTLTGWYEVRDVSATYLDWGGVGKVDWNVSLRRVGAPSGVDVESRLTGVARVNDYSVTGERWHAPALGATAYWTGTTQPTTMTRTGQDGAMTVYRGVPASVNPRWVIAPDGFYGGAAYVAVAGATRSAVHVDVDPIDWEIGNTLVRVGHGDTGTLLVSSYDPSGEWDPVTWNVSATGALTGGITAWDGVSILRNTPEACALRMVKDLAPGRALLDLTVRRGSRLIEGYLSVDRSTTAGLYLPDSAVLLSNYSSEGYTFGYDDNTLGNKMLAGTPRSCVWSSDRGIYKASTTVFSFYLGHIIGGGSSASGDSATDLRAQYMLSSAESTALARR